MPTSALPRGRQTKLRLGWETVYGTAPVSGWQEINPYTHDLVRTRTLEADDILGAGFFDTVSARPAAPNVEDATGKLSAPLDLAQIGFWLAATLGRVTPTGSGTFVHAFVSGTTPLPSFSLEREFVAAAQYDGGAGLVVKSLKLPFKPGKGYTAVDIDLVGSQILAPYAATIAGTPTVNTLTNRVANYVGALTIAGVQVGQAIDATLTITNDITLDRYISDSEYVAAAILEGQDVAVDATIRYSTDALRAFGVVDPAYLPPIESMQLVWAPAGSTASLVVAMPNVRFEPINLPVTNGKTITQTMKGRAEVGSGAMLSATLTNSHSSEY